MNPTLDAAAVHLTGIAAGPQPRLVTLDEALAYRNDEILHKFRERWDVSFDEAAELFEETKKWLWVQVAARHRPDAPPLAMTVALAMVDEMLHTFILFTREYTAYCLSTYGAYLHHTPMTKAHKDSRIARYQADPQAMLAEEARFLERMYAFTYDLLGEATVRKWYAEYPVRYSGARMVELMRSDGRRFTRAGTVAAQEEVAVS